MKILIFKLGFIGDVIMSLPALLTLRQQYPDAHITWVVDKPALPILQATNLVDRLVVLEEKKISTGSLWQRITELLAFWKRLGLGQYDLRISGHADSKVDILLLPARTKRRKQFNRDGRAWKPIFPVPGRHHSHEFIKLFTDVPYPNATPVTYPTLTLPPLPKHIIMPARPFVALAPGGTQSTNQGGGWLRRWPIDKYVALAQKLLNEGHTVVLAGGKDDEWVLESFASVGLNLPSFIGKLSVLETIQLLSHSELLITNDCGPLHFAALANAPVLSIFGPTDPHEKVPLHGKATYIWGGEHLSCRPCYDNKVYAACQHNECISSVSVERVWEEVKTQINHEKATY